MKKKILVTGGTGYIGSHTAVELINEGFDVAIIDNLYNSEKEVIDGIEKISGIKPSLEIIDICDKEKLDGFFSRNMQKFHQCIHTGNVFAEYGLHWLDLFIPRWIYRF